MKVGDASLPGIEVVVLETGFRWTVLPMTELKRPATMNEAAGKSLAEKTKLAAAWLRNGIDYKGGLRELEQAARTLKHHCRTTDGVD